MHVLLYRGTPIACAERLERLSDRMVHYTAIQQSEMCIVSVQELKDD